MRTRTLALTFALLLFVSACATGTEGGGTTVAGDDGGASTTAGGDGAATTAGETSGDGVRTAESDLGTILVDPNGFTLYVFTADLNGASSCYDACAETWPPVSADTPIASDLDESMFGSTSRDDGTEQLTVNNQPLYLYAPDTSPGDVNGQGVGDAWFVVGPDGAMVGPEAAGSRADY